MNIRKAQIIKSLRAKYNIFSFDGRILTRNGVAIKGESRIVEIKVPEFVVHLLLK